MELAYGCPLQPGAPQVMDPLLSVPHKAQVRVEVLSLPLKTPGSGPGEVIIGL